MDMVERVARAIYAHMPKPVIPIEWDGLVDGGLQYIGMAMVAIEAMRDPTKEMIAAGYKPWHGDSEAPAIEVSWPLMIDAALNEES